jgi:hypothetical protein
VSVKKDQNFEHGEMDPAWGRALSGRWEDPMMVAVRGMAELVRGRLRAEAEAMGVESRRRDELCVSAGTLTDFLADLEEMCRPERDKSEEV